MKTTRVTTIGELKDAIKDIPDNTIIATPSSEGPGKGASITHMPFAEEDSEYMEMLSAQWDQNIYQLSDSYVTLSDSGY